MFAEQEIGTRMIHNIQLLGIASIHLRVHVCECKGLREGERKRGEGKGERDRQRERERMSE